MGQMEAVKTERITILGTPEFKTFLRTEAKNEGISVSQLVRQRCEMRGEDEEMLSALAGQVEAATRKAMASLNRGLAEASATLAELRKGRGE